MTMGLDLEIDASSSQGLTVPQPLTLNQSIYWLFIVCERNKSSKFVK